MIAKISKFTKIRTSRKASDIENRLKINVQSYYQIVESIMV